MDGQLNWDRQRGFVAPARPQSRERDPSLATIAQLRAFSLLLCLDAKLANELVEITLLRVCVATNPSHLNPSHLAWLIARLRTYFYAEFAHRRRAIDPPVAASQLHLAASRRRARGLHELDRRAARGIDPDRSRRFVLQSGGPDLPEAFPDLQEVRRAGACRPCFLLGLRRRRRGKGAERVSPRSLTDFQAIISTTFPKQKEPMAHGAPPALTAYAHDECG